MSKTNKIILMGFVIIMLILGIGYAAIQNITLNISGTASADPSQENFNVMFYGIQEVSNFELVSAEITNNTNATINVSGLTEKGQKEYATYTIKNESADLSAELSALITNSNEEYFLISYQIEETSLIAGEMTLLKIVVELIKTPLDESVNSTIGVELKAAPVQPGEMENDETNNDLPQVPALTLENITNDNIGEYIDLGNNIVGTESTEDDWRILYRDPNVVHVILADYLPANQVPTSLGLDTNVTSKPYSVWHEAGRAELVNALKYTYAWASFANGIEGATVTGAPTPSLLMDSYNAKNGSWYHYTDYPLLIGNLYSLSNKCDGYWLAGAVEGEDTSILWKVGSDGSVGYQYFADDGHSARPVVALPTTTKVNLVDGVWSVLK